MSTVTMTNNIGSLAAGGNIENNNIVINILGKSQEYTILLSQKKEYEEIIADLPKQKQDRIEVYTLKIAQIEKEIESFKATVINLTKQFSEIEIDAERVQVARQLFEEGNITEAQNALSEEELDEDYEKLMAWSKEKQKELEDNAKKIRQIAEQFFLKAQITSLNYADADRKENAKKYYERSLSIFSYSLNVTEYTRFLRDICDYSKAIEILLKTLQAEEIMPFEKKLYLTLLSVAYTDIKDYSKATQCIEDAMKVAAQSDEPPIYSIIAQHLDAGTLLLKAALLFDKKEYKECFETFELLLKIRRLVSESLPRLMILFEIEALSILTSWLLSLEEFEKGLQYYEKAIDLSREYFKEPVELSYLEFPTTVVRYMSLDLHLLLEAQLIADDKKNEYYELTLFMVNEYERIVEESKSRQAYETLAFAFYYLYQVLLLHSDDDASPFLKKSVDYISKYRNDIQENDDNTYLLGCLNCFLYDYNVDHGLLPDKESRIAFLEHIVDLMDSVKVQTQTVVTLRNNLLPQIAKIKDEQIV